MFSCKSYDELSKIINDWLGEGESEEPEETTYSNTSGSSSKKEETKSGYSNLDDAFADLMSD